MFTATISQVVSGLVAGQRYRIRGQFISAYPSFGDPAALSFGVLADNVLLGELVRPPQDTWQEFAFEFIASSSSMTITLAAERNGDDSSYGVDNVVLEPIRNGSIAVAADALSATFTPAAALSWPASFESGPVTRSMIRCHVSEAERCGMELISRRTLTSCFPSEP